MDVFLDTGFILSLLIETDKTEIARKFFDNFDRTKSSLITSISVYEETFYVGIRMIAEDRLGIRNPYSLRDYIKRNGYDFADDYLDNMREVFDFLRVVNDTENLKVVETMAKNYRLLPNDALIAATCKHYGIKKIATFDDDFKRVDFLEIVKMK